MKQENFFLDSFEPAYLQLSLQELQQRAQSALKALQSCTLCPRGCQVNRLVEETGVCQTGRRARVCSAFAHHGEEACLRGWNGSGTIFFGGCSLQCVFCQNWDISHSKAGREVNAEVLCELMLELQRQGCHNINLVTPTHVVPQILEALALAIPQGLTLPVVYNSGGYDCLETLRWLEGVVDIYMPDFKFWNRRTAALLANAADYPERARAALQEMHRQVGVLKFGRDGLAKRGVLVRHLVMPGLVHETEQIMQWLATELSPDCFVNIMAQYRPEYLVLSGGGSERSEYELINRTPTAEEIEQAFGAARRAGLRRFEWEP